MLAPSNARRGRERPAGVPAASVSGADPGSRGARTNLYFAFEITRISFARFAPAPSLKYTTT